MRSKAACHILMTFPSLRKSLRGGVDTNVWGTGFTPEGIDQNPVYYEFMMNRNWATAPSPNITEDVIARSLKRYGIDYNENIATSWALMVCNFYCESA